MAQIKKILLINVADNSKFNFSTHFGYPLGIMLLSSSIKNRFKKKIDIKLVDLAVENDGVHLLQSCLMEFQPDFVGISSMSIFSQLFHNIAHDVKVFSSQIFVTGGGPYPTHTPNSIMKDINIDYLVMGEGEESLVKLIEYLNNDSLNNISEISGLCYRQGKRLVKNVIKPIENLNNIPYPDFDSIDLKSYFKRRNWTGAIFPYLSILTSRGCSYKCSFCHQIFGKRVRKRSVSNVIDEITYLKKKFNVKDFFIIDDIFNQDKKTSNLIFSELIKKFSDIKIHLPGGIRGDILNEEFLDHFCTLCDTMLVVAVETASNDIQKKIHKYLNLQKVSKNLQIARQKKIPVQGFFMIGFPKETESQMVETLKYSIENPFSLALFFIVQYFEGTDLHKMAIKQGIKETKIKNNYFNSSILDFNQQTPSALNKLKLQEVYHECYRSFYVNPEKLKLLNEIKLNQNLRAHIYLIYRLFFGMYFNFDFLEVRKNLPNNYDFKNFKELLDPNFIKGAFEKRRSLREYSNSFFGEIFLLSVKNSPQADIGDISETGFFLITDLNLELFSTIKIKVGISLKYRFIIKMMNLFYKSHNFLAIKGIKKLPGNFTMEAIVIHKTIKKGKIGFGCAYTKNSDESLMKIFYQFIFFKSQL